MRIGLISDTHDNLANTQSAAQILVDRGIDTVLHCGDVCGPTIVESLGDFTVYYAMGNMDRSSSLRAAVEATQGKKRLARHHTLVLGGFHIAVLHGHDEARLARIVHSGLYAYVFHGHTHYSSDHVIGSARVICPGALGGRKPEQRTFCILDLETGSADFVQLSESQENQE